MSAASTDAAVEHSHPHAPPSGDGLKPPGVALDELAASDKPLIAVDLDDVLSQTNRVVAECQSIPHSRDADWTEDAFCRAQRHLWNEHDAGGFPLSVHYNPLLVPFLVADFRAKIITTGG